MTDFQGRLSKKRADIQSRFNELETRRKQYVSQRADMDRAIAVTMEEQTRLQGEFRLLEDLSSEENRPQPKLKIPKEKKKK